MDELESLVGVALADPSMELEIRLGKIAFGRFQTDVPPAAWTYVKDRLETYERWTRTEVTAFTDDHFADGHRRRTFSDGRVEIIRKERIVTHDVPMAGRSMDLRVSLAREAKRQGNEVPADVRIASKESKKRYRFVHKDLWAFELTEIEGPSGDIDSECSTRHQIEIEFLPSAAARKYPCKYLADYGKLLAEDVLGMVLSQKA